MPPAAASAVVRNALLRGAGGTDAFAPGARVVVGFSGGQDSTCLLHALAHWRHKGPLRLIAAHVDHGLRAESSDEAERNAEVARALGADEVEVRRVDVVAYRAGLKRWTVQQAARAARYLALASVVREREARALVVAHTADDQAETLLLNLLRGSGLAGLAGMRAAEEVEPLSYGPLPGELRASQVPPRMLVVRPLLSVERRATLAYCQELGLPILEDPSNLGRGYTRNRVRHDLLPVLERFNPAVRSVLARTADLAAEEDAALDWLARPLHRGLVRPIGPDVLRYQLPEWRGLPRGVQRRLLRLGTEALSGGLKDVPVAPLEDALDLLETYSGGEERFYHLPRGLELRVRGSEMELRRRAGGAAIPREGDDASI